METFRRAIQVCQDNHVGLWLLVAGVVLIVADYFFDTDIPAHFGYACIAAMAFLLVPETILLSLAVGIGVWVLLELFHYLWFRRILAVAPPTSESPPPSAGGK